MTRRRRINGTSPLQDVGQKVRKDVKEHFASKTHFLSPAEALFPSIFHRGLIPLMLVELWTSATCINQVTDMLEIDLEVSSFVGINTQPALDHFEPC
jgi:hypothetical protein